jgi:hypothetical protein
MPNPQEPAWLTAFFNANPKVQVLDLPVRQPLARRSGMDPAESRAKRRIQEFFLR